MKTHVLETSKLLKPKWIWKSGKPKTPPGLIYSMKVKCGIVENHYSFDVRNKVEIYMPMTSNNE